MSADLGMFKNALFEDLMVLKRFKTIGARLMVLQSTVGNAAKVLRTGCPVCWFAEVCGRTEWSCNRDSST